MSNMTKHLALFHKDVRDWVAQTTTEFYTVQRYLSAIII